MAYYVLGLGFVFFRERRLEACWDCRWSIVLSFLVGEFAGPHSWPDNPLPRHDLGSARLP